MKEEKLFEHFWISSTYIIALSLTRYGVFLQVVAFLSGGLTFSWIDSFIFGKLWRVRSVVLKNGGFDTGLYFWLAYGGIE